MYDSYFNKLTDKQKKKYYWSIKIIWALLLLGGYMLFSFSDYGEMTARF